MTSQKLKSLLQDDSKIFFFLGFEFDKWYTQLLLRLICGEKESIRYAALNKNMDNDTHDFIFYQFKVDFIENEIDFLSSLYNLCADKKILRNLNESKSDNKQNNVIESIIQNDIYGALKHLSQKEDIDLDTKNTIISLKSRFQFIQEKHEKGIIDIRDFDLFFNQIKDVIIQMATNQH